MEKYDTTELFEFKITNNPKITYKNKKKGRTKKGEKPEKVEVVTDCYSVNLTFKDNAYQDQLYKCGYYPLITNMPKETFTILC